MHNKGHNMRQIKFRAWTFGELWEVERIEWHKGKIMNVNISRSPSNDYWFASSKELLNLMQYTGLDDKNGEEIYEGDIYTQGEKSIKYVVIFNDCSFVGRQVGNQSLAGLTYFSDYIEIIGNIHENPDLIT